MALKIRNWHKFQHFKDRKPPWIKLYRDLLDDRSWYELSDSAAKLLISLWLLASEDDRQEGHLPPLQEIAFRLRIDIRSIKSNISKLNNWLIQDDITVISDSNTISAGYQDDPLETETETETYKPEREQRSPSGSRLQIEALPEDWQNYASKERPELDAKRVFQDFRDYWIAVPGSKGRKLDWLSTWRKWVRNQGGNGNGKSKFSAIQYNAQQLAKSMDAGAISKTVSDVHGEVQPLLPRSRDD